MVQQQADVHQVLSEFQMFGGGAERGGRGRGD